MIAQTRVSHHATRTSQRSRLLLTTIPSLRTPPPTTSKRRGVFPVTATSSSSDEEGERVPIGCSRYTISISKPLGLVLEERKEGGIIVAGLVENGNAAATGLVSVGDELISTSGFTRTGQELVYGEIVVRGGEKIIRLSVRGESFDVVMAAISSIPGNKKVDLEFQKCD